MVAHMSCGFQLFLPVSVAAAKIIMVINNNNSNNMKHTHINLWIKFKLRNAHLHYPVQWWFDFTYFVILERVKMWDFCKSFVGLFPQMLCSDQFLILCCLVETNKEWQLKENFENSANRLVSFLLQYLMRLLVTLWYLFNVNSLCKCVSLV